MSNPIASETTPKKWECPTVDQLLDAFVKRYNDVRDREWLIKFGEACMSYGKTDGAMYGKEGVPASDPSGKGARELAVKLALKHRLSHFVQGDDGYGGEDEPNEKAVAAIMEALSEASSLRQQLSELNEKLALREKCSMAIMRDCPTHGESEQLKSLRKELSELGADLRINRDYFQDKVSVLTKEREALRLRIAAWEKLFPMSRFVIEADDAKQILAQDFVHKSAVSEVVRLAKLR